MCVKIVVPKHVQHVYIHNVLLVGCSDCLVACVGTVGVHVCLCVFRSASNFILERQVGGWKLDIFSCS